MSVTTAADNVRLQRNAFRPYGLLVLVVVVLTSELRPAAAAPLAVFAAAMLLVVTERSLGIAIVVMAAAAVALAVVEPGRAAPQIAGTAAVWLAVIRYGMPRGVLLALATTGGLIAAVAAGGKAGLVLSVVLAATLIGVVAFFVRVTRQNERRMEILLAELEDARDEQLETAALSERSRIARELHDVLAHALSGAAIQLQGARVLADRTESSDAVRDAIDRAAELVRDGLGSAREAVDALRSDAPLGAPQLPALVAHHRNASFAVEGDERPLPPPVGLALYRTAQEALTNVARYATDAPTSVVLRYDTERVRLSVVNAAAECGLDGVGGGRGLVGLRERAAELGGTLEAGPAEDGWRVELEAPA